MPSAPELLKVARDIGRVEVLRQLVPEERGAPDGDVAVTGEIGVDLDRVTVDRQEHLERREALGGREHAVHERLGEVISDDDLLREASGDA